MNANEAGPDQGLVGYLMLIKALMAYQTEVGIPLFLAYLLFVMEGTIEQRLNTVEKTLATVSQLVPKKKDWRLAGFATRLLIVKWIGLAGSIGSNKTRCHKESCAGSRH